MSDDADTIRRTAQDVLAGVPGARYMGADRELAEGALALLAENQRLRDALKQIAEATQGTNPMIVGVSVSQLAGFARAALAAVRVEDER